MEEAVGPGCEEAQAVGHAGHVIQQAGDDDVGDVLVVLSLDPFHVVLQHPNVMEVESALHVEQHSAKIVVPHQALYHHMHPMLPEV